MRRVAVTTAMRATLATVSLLLSSATVAAPAAATAAPCSALIEAQRAAEADPRRVREAAALLPPVMGRRVAEESGRSDNAAAAVVVLKRAIALRCPTTTTAPPTTSSLQALVASDPRFGGLRVDRTLSDRLLEKVWAFVEMLLESESMQRFSEHTRTLYLALLAAACAFVAFRIWRRHPLAVAGVVDDASAVVERRRREAFSALRDAAIAARAADPRTAALLLRRALLSRVGEIDDGAASPAKTSREVLLRLPKAVAELVAPALSTFDRAFFADAVDDDALDGLINDVDRADAGLAALGPGAARRR